MLAESIGRKKVIVPSLYALTVPTLLAATSQNLHQLIFWRFMQGIFVPGVIVVMMAYIGEEFGGAYVGRAMASYITGTVLGGFGGRFISGMVAHHLDWRDAFIVIGLVNLAGAIMVQRWLPIAKNFVRAERVRHSLSHAKGHLWTRDCWRSSAWALQRCSVWWARLHMPTSILPAPPYHLNSAQLGSIFCVYLFGLIVTPLAGRCLDHYGIRVTSAIGFGFAAVGLLLTLVHSLAVIIVGLALLPQACSSIRRLGQCRPEWSPARRARRPRDCMSRSTTLAEVWERSSPMDVGGWGLATMRVSDGGDCRDGGGDGLREQWEAGCEIGAVSYEPRALSCELRAVGSRPSAVCYSVSTSTPKMASS